MGQFLIWSLVGSIGLTVALNLLPALFPDAAARAERKLMEAVQSQHADRTDPNTPRVKLFFPWKAMLIGSVALTVLVNLVGLLAR
ncbi:hypothetical protein [uncultured Algimonas sp.]|uniref:hypothetical protein n=1 Tax=uncultured Algimonas sp. TaxID=1547920 RepID=UPI002626B99E|nr:hypothetical protein [uncultured Algimonas sp.]